MSNNSSQGAVSIDVHHHFNPTFKDNESNPWSVRMALDELDRNGIASRSRRLVPSTAQIATNAAGKHGTGMSGVPGFAYNTLAALACPRRGHSRTPTSHFPKSRTPMTSYLRTASAFLPVTAASGLAISAMLRSLPNLSAARQQ
jgi:hypothetical protein